MAYGGYHQLQALVVDDFKQFCDTVRRMLEEFGISSVDSAANGNQALQLCQNKAYDLILCDYNLGEGKNGQHVLESLRHSKTLKSDVLFLLITAEASKSIVMASYDNNPDAYLTKPINAKTLKQRLDRLLKQRDQMKSIYQSIELNQVDKAIAQCEAKVVEGGREATECQKLLGELYLRQQRYDLAEEVFRRALEVRPLDWAKIGLARVKKAQGETTPAAESLKEIIADNPLCMPAYDLLVETCDEMGEVGLAQTTLQQAASISPLSILRQQRLAEKAEANNDLGTAAEAYLHSVKLGTHSCHDRVENHINLGRTTAALFAENDNRAQDLSSEAFRALEEVAMRFGSSAEQNIQLLLVQSQMHSGLGSHTKADELLQEAEQMIDGLDDDMEVDTQLDLVQALTANDHKQKAKDLLSNLVERHKGDESALEKIDRLLEEPQSAANRQRVAALNREGIDLYNQHHYKESFACFKRAKQLFPKHIGIHLNLAQALTGEMQEYGYNPKLMELSLATLQKVEARITPTHSQFSRYRQLCEKTRELERQ